MTRGTSVCKGKLHMWYKEVKQMDKAEWEKIDEHHKGYKN